MKSDNARAQFFKALLEDALFSYGVADCDAAKAYLTEARGLYPSPSRRGVQDDLGSWLNSCILIAEHPPEDLLWRRWHAQPTHEALMRKATSAAAESIKEEEDQRVMDLLAQYQWTPQDTGTRSSRPRGLREIGMALFPVEQLPDGALPIYYNPPGEEEG